MEYTIMEVDLILKFRLAVLPHKSPRPQTWQMDVMTIEDVEEVLVSLGFLDSDAARKLAEYYGRSSTRFEHGPFDVHGRPS